MRKFLLFFVLFSFFSCEKKNTDDESRGKVQLTVLYEVDGESLTTDSLMYMNEAGNHYLINEIQWFISNVKLKSSNGQKILFTNSEQNVFYFDTDLPETNIVEGVDIETNTFEKIIFTFGFNETDNISNRFPNPPESFMFWPEYLGGGYHYMKLNGKWVNEENRLEPFNFHLGIGQDYSDKNKFNDPIFYFGKSSEYAHCEGYEPPFLLKAVNTFIHNYFVVEIPVDFEVKKDEVTELKLVMQIDKWFKNPNVYDHNVYGGAIMQNQNAMAAACENGKNVFVIRR